MSIDQWPFYPDSLLEIMGPEKEKREIAKELFEFLQAGCAVALRRSTTIIDAKGEWICLDPPEFQFTENCRFFRFDNKKDTEIKECPGGNERCLGWDTYKAKNVMNNIRIRKYSQEDSIYHCHLGLTDILYPFCIASNPVAVIFSGQFLREENDEDDETARARIRNNINQLKNGINPFDEPKLHNVTISNENEKRLSKSVDELDILTDKFKQDFYRQAKRINKIAEEYWQQYKRSMEENFLEDLREIRAKMGKSESHEDITENVTKLLEMICKKLNISWIAFFADWDWDGEGNLLDLEASFGLLTKDSLKDSPHFNLNKSRIETDSWNKTITSINPITKYLENGLKYSTNNPFDEQIKAAIITKFMEASFMYPQKRGSEHVRTLFLFGPFTTKVNIQEEDEFLKAICNFLTDNYRHDRRLVKIHEKNKQLYEIGDLISHQIRSILHPLKSSVELLIKAHNYDIDVSNDVVQKYADNMKHQIQYLANYSKMTVGVAGSTTKSESVTRFERNKYEEQDISLIVSTIVDNFKQHAKNKKIHFLKRKGLYKKYQAEIIPNYFETAVSNILENAIKYARESTSITVDMRIDTESIIWASYVEIIIGDYGYGILQEDKEKIFKKGVQGKLRGALPGEGLGLFEANKIVRSHGGSIRCDCNQGNSKRDDDWYVEFIIAVPKNQDFRSLRNG